MNPYKLEVIMNGAITNIWVQTTEEAEKIYGAIKQTMDSYDALAFRNKDGDDRTVEVGTSYGNKYAFRVAALQSVTLAPGENPTWFDEFLVDQTKKGERLRKLASAEDEPR
jgi:hypothetical protein